MNDPVTGARGSFSAAVETLREQDVVLRGIIDRVGPCTLVSERGAFPALTEAIIHQQLSIKAAATIVRRFLGLFPRRDFPTPADVLEVPEETLRGAGISGQKTRYLKDLARKFQQGVVAPDRFPAMSDQEIADTLTQVKGIGRWTAEMFLIFSLCRPNVLPVDDLGLRRAVALHYGAAEEHPELHIRRLAERWQPHCTVATWYLWRSLDVAGQASGS